MPPPEAGSVLVPPRECSGSNLFQRYRRPVPLREPSGGRIHGSEEPTQASLAIQLTRLANTATQSAVLGERNRLAGEIHDTLAQSFAGISMQLELAQEEMAGMEGGPLGYVRNAYETAKFGLAEARRSVLSLRSSAPRESG